MKFFGLNITRTKQHEVISKPQIRDNAPQGIMTEHFKDYYLRKVSGDFYEALREGIPIIDAGIRHLISLNGTIEIIGDNPKIVKALEDFAMNVPVNDTQKGIQAFLENSSNETFEQGFSLSEMIATKDMKDIAGLRVADSKHIVYRRNAEGRAEPWYRYPGNMPVRVYSNPQSLPQQILTASYNQSLYISGINEIKLNPANLLHFSIDNENTNPYGVSKLRSMEFVSKILMTMENSLLNVWERFGDPSYHIHYKTSSRDGDTVETRRQKLATDFNTAITSKRAGKSADFVTATDKDSDIVIKIIGSDGQELDMEIPVRHVLEQIVSKFGLPSWMLGLYWSTTERMSILEMESALQDAEVRQTIMLPEYVRLFSIFLTLRGFKWNSITTDPEKPGDWGMRFVTPNLRNRETLSRANFLDAQAEMVRGNTGNNQNQPKSAKENINIRTRKGCGCHEKGGQTVLNIDGKVVDIAQLARELAPFLNKTKTISDRWTEIKTISCSKETRPIPHPEVEQVEKEYEGSLVASTDELEVTVLTILNLLPTGKSGKAPEDLPDPLTFTFTEEQRAQVYKAMDDFVGSWDPAKDPDKLIAFYYGESYSLGLIQAARLLGKERPILDIIKNSEIYDELVRDGFKLVKEGTTREIQNKIIAEMEAQVLAGSNPRHVANRLAGIFDDANQNWARLSRSEMAMASERGKLEEMKAEGETRVFFYVAADGCPICQALKGEYDINDAPVAVRDTHPNCYCTLGPVGEAV